MLTDVTQTDRNDTHVSFLIQLHLPFARSTVVSSCDVWSLKTPLLNMRTLHFHILVPELSEVKLNPNVQPNVNVRIATDFLLAVQLCLLMAFCPIAVVIF